MSQFIRKAEGMSEVISSLIKSHAHLIEMYEQAMVFNSEDANLLSQFKNEQIFFLQELNRIFKKHQAISGVDNNAKIKSINGVIRGTGKTFEKKQVINTLIEEELNKYCF